jgi:hypothetical protein
MASAMSAMPSTVPLVERRRVPWLGGIAAVGRTTLLLCMVLLVPGEAARIGGAISPGARQPAE